MTVSRRRCAALAALAALAGACGGGGASGGAGGSTGTGDAGRIDAAGGAGGAGGAPGVVDAAADVNNCPRAPSPPPTGRNVLGGAYAFGLGATHGRGDATELQILYTPDTRACADAWDTGKVALFVNLLNTPGFGDGTPLRPGTYDVKGSAPSASVQLNNVPAVGQVLQAACGRVTLTEIGANAVGTFAVVMTDGQTLSGRFDVAVCAK
jgi:hypothetical protein